MTNARPGDLVLFGALLVWAVLVFRAARRRDRASGRDAPGSWPMAAVATVAGVAAWAVFARFLHPLLIGVPVA